MNSYDFNSKYIMSIHSEELLYNYFKKFFTIDTLEDDMSYQLNGIDWKISKYDSTKYVELKADKRGKDTGNMFFEVKSNSNKRTEGCMLYSKSDYIFYHFTGINHVQIYQTKLLQDWYNSNKNKGYFEISNRKVVNTDGLYNTYGYTVPTSSIPPEVIKYDVWL